MNEKTKLKPGFAVFAVLSLLACETPQTLPKEPLTFRYQLPASPGTLDPASSGDLYTDGIVDRLFDGLMRLDRVRNVPVPEFSESYEVSPDGLLYEFRLFDEARFHNGRQVTASDFKYSWERLLAPERKSPRSWFFDLVEGVDAYRSGEAGDVSGIEVDGLDVIRIRLREPFAPFLYHLAHPATSVPQEDVERLGPEFGNQPVGSGPYRFVSREDVRITLSAFDDHPRHKPQVKRLVYEIVPDGNEALRRYQAGELDLLSWLPSGSLTSIRQTYAADLKTFPGTGWYGFCFRCDREPFDDPRIRQAFSLAIDRDALVHELGELQYTAAVGFVPQGIPGHDSSTLSSGYDLDRAKELLAEAGYPQGQGFPAQIFVTRQGDLDARVADHLVNALADLEIEVTFTAMDYNALLSADREGRLHFFRKGWGGEYPDPDPYVRPIFHSQGSENTGYKNSEVDRLLDLARTEQDDGYRLELYRQATALIRQDAPCVVLYHLTEAVLLRPRWRNVPLGYDPAYLEIERAALADGGS